MVNDTRDKLRINWVLPRASLAGGVKSNHLLAEAMVRRGHAVSIAFVNRGSPWPPPWRVRSFGRRAWAQWKILGQPRHHLMESTTQLIPVNANEILASDVPDADVTIATWWSTMEWIADWPAAKGLHVHFVRGDERTISQRMRERIEAVYKIPGLKLTISRWLEQMMRDTFGHADVVLVPNGVNWQQFNAEPRGKAVRPTVGFMYGREALKGAATAIDAIRLAQRQVPDLRVIAFGAEPLVKDTRLPANFEFHHRPAQSEIPELYRQTDCWIVPSTSEGFGMPGIEAAACRCPLVTTRCGGPEDYTRHGENGFLVDVGDAADMARRIVEIVTADEATWQVMSEASHAIARKFDWDKSAEILEAALYVALDRARAVPHRSEHCLT